MILILVVLYIPAAVFTTYVLQHSIKLNFTRFSLLFLSEHFAMIQVTNESYMRNIQIYYSGELTYEENESNG